MNDLSPSDLPTGTTGQGNAHALVFFRDRDLPLSGIVLSLFDQSDDCIKLLDLEGALQFMNCNGRQAMEVDDFSAIAGQPWHSLWPEEAQGLVAAAVGQARAGQFSRFEAFCPTAKGSPRWWDVTVTPIRSEDGHVSAILSSSRDISDRRVREEALASIAAEMKHRLRNAYTVGAAVSMAMAKDQPEHASFARELASRMVGLAEVQARLVDVDATTLADIVPGVVHSFGHADAVQIDIISDVSLSEPQAKALALVLGELSTNSLKYGALSGRGRVHVSAKASGGDVELEWREVHEITTPSLDFSQVGGGSGRQLMERMLASVGGSLQSASSEEGYRALIRLPVLMREDSFS